MTRQKPKYDAIIVPGGGVDLEGKLNSFMEEKLDRAAKLHNKGLTDYLLVSGGISNSLPKDQYPITEAAAMKRYLIGKEVPENDILTEENARNTIGNAYYSRVIHLDHMYADRESPKAKNILLLTGKTHMPRAKETFEWVYGPDYNIETEVVEDDHIDGKQGIQARVEREKKLMEWQKNNLFTNIKAGDLPSIHSFLTNPHGQDKLANQYAEFLVKLNQTNHGFYG